MRRPWPTRANSKRHTIPRSASGRKPTCCEPGIPEAAPFRRLPKSYYIYLIRVVLRKWLRCDSVDSPHDESLPDSALPASSPRHHADLRHGNAISCLSQGLPHFRIVGTTTIRLNRPLPEQGLHQIG